MNQPFTGERFWSDGRRAHWRGPSGKARRIEHARLRAARDAVLTSTHPDLFAPAEEAARFNAVRSRVRMTRFGGDCYGYCLLAAGFVDLIIEAGLKTYDIVALVPIIEAAGGLVTTWDGGPASEGGRIVAAGDRRVHQEAMAILGGGRLSANVVCFPAIGMHAERKSRRLLRALPLDDQAVVLRAGGGGRS